MSHDDQPPAREAAPGQAVPKDPAPATAPAIPVTAGEDDPRSWGDTPDDHDAWLREQRPPHWG
ncbi:hypothetical protein [Arthrobacter sp. L77]|uniref:hypothetical protein n=1 Tax=Arthrobacter sp. L77 TaxID=1496689 RepID=UPI000A434CE6|nr:hypothetical protein [Arthrobacter sp. L77]